jgi:hypothetical protein
MKGLKRYIPPGVALSLIGHFGILLLGLFLVSANPAQNPAQPEPAEVDVIPADATEVDLVTPSEAPRFQGETSDIRASGTKTPADSPNAIPAAPSPTARQEPQQPQPPQQQAQKQPQQPPQKQRSEQPPAVQPKGPQPDTAAAETAPPDLPQPDKTAESAEPKPTAQNEPQPKEPVPQSETAEMVAQLALAGGPLGGGFVAPPVDTNKAGYDFTLEFRERVSWCSQDPEATTNGERVSVMIRVSLNPDGTLSTPPRPLEPIVSDGQRALLRRAVNALQRCQPYTMLPRDKYKQWKTLDLTIYPISLPGG